MRLNYYRFPDDASEDVLKEYGCTKEDDTIEGVSVTTAKQMLRKFGGCAWTEHCERDGSVFETSDIKLEGNNSRFKYNRHL